MDLQDIVIKVNVKDLETAEAVCNMTVPYGIYIEDYSDLEAEAENIAHINLIDEELINKDRTTALIHIYIPLNESSEEALAYLSERFSALNITYTYTVNTVFESDYKDKWKEYFKITEVGKNLLICPSWETANGEGKTVIKIDPGAAFGTGRHETTASCLELLEKYVNNESTVLDIGCGSGILAVSAALLGAKKADGFDIDSMAVKVAKSTAELNNVKNCFFYLGDATENIGGKYDIVVANIVADVIIAISGKIAPLLNKDGIFICSGIIEGREEEVKTALINAGFNICDTVKKDNWYCFGGKYVRV